MPCLRLVSAGRFFNMNLNVLSQLFLALLTLSFSPFILAIDMSPIPHVSKKANDSFLYDYAYATNHRAFAIASDGAWSWTAKKDTVEQAKVDALAACARYTEQDCMLYAVNNQIVFDVNTWRQSWGPYKNKAQALSSSSGTKLGQKFPDIAYVTPDNQTSSIHQHLGKIVFVHFWGCWCPPCGFEFTALTDLYQIINDLMPGQVEFIILQVREPIEQARAWAADKQFTALPLSDSGVKDSEDEELTLRDGTRVADRTFARAFPASYILDKHGINVFSHMGSIDYWTELLPFFMDVEKRSGK